jgi:hypothetical protein
MYTVRTQSGWGNADFPNGWSERYLPWQGNSLIEALQLAVNSVDEGVTVHIFDSRVTATADTASVQVTKVGDLITIDELVSIEPPF